MPLESWALCCFSLCHMATSSRPIIHRVYGSLLTSERTDLPLQEPEASALIALKPTIGSISEDEHLDLNVSRKNQFRLVGSLEYFSAQPLGLGKGSATGENICRMNTYLRRKRCGTPRE